MRTALSRLELLSPRSLPEALRLLATEGPLTPLAGCTDVYVGLNFGTLSARRFLDLSGLRALQGITRVRGGGLRLGALTTFAEIGRSALIARHAPILAQAARQIGGAQIQNRGTIGGNVANASPAADAVPVLAVAEATFVVASARGQRRLPADGFFTGYRQTALAADELILAIELPALPPRAFFRKVGTRAANAISKVVMAGVLGDRPRLALGSVGPTVVRARRTEEAIAAGAAPAEAAAVLAAEIAPIDDLRSTAAYRRQVAANLLRQLLEAPSP